jgi:hypothetical protein
MQFLSLLHFPSDEIVLRWIFIGENFDWVNSELLAHLTGLRGGLKKNGLVQG